MDTLTIFERTHLGPGKWLDLGLVVRGTRGDLPSLVSNSRMNSICASRGEGKVGMVLVLFDMVTEFISCCFGGLLVLCG